MVTTFYPPRSFGGDAVAVQSLARALVRGGHHVTVICDDDAYRTLSGNRDRGPPEVDDGVVVHRLASRLGSLAVALTQQTGRPDRARRDLCGASSSRARSTSSTITTSRSSAVPPRSRSVGRQAVHGARALAGLPHARALAVSHRSPARRGSARAVSSATAVRRSCGVTPDCSSASSHHVDAFIAMSRFSRDKHREFGFPRDMEVLPGFMSDPGPPRRRAPRPAERPYFLFVGRLESIKGLEDVIDALRDVRRCGPRDRR